LKATLTSNGNPIGGTDVNFYLANGTLISSNTTGPDGIAIIYYTI